jgi:pyruvate-formate lyase
MPTKIIERTRTEISNLIATRPVAELSDDEVLALSKMKMTRRQSERLHELLSKRKEIDLTVEEQQDFLVLMRLYEIGMLRKSEALAEAVQRGLRGPMHP